MRLPVVSGEGFKVERKMSGTPTPVNPYNDRPTVGLFDLAGHLDVGEEGFLETVDDEPDEEGLVAALPKILDVRPM